MEDLKKEQTRLAQKAHYSKAIDKVQEAIALLEHARASIAADPSTTALNIAKVKQNVKKSFDGANDNLKEVNSGLKGYQKALDKTFKVPLDDTDKDPLQNKGYLINRAIAMHLLREGQFNVATTFVDETSRNDSMFVRSPGPGGEHEWEVKSEILHRQFEGMYHILDELRQKHNLEPAIQWAGKYSGKLETRGSNLEFELCRLKFIALFVGSRDEDIDMDASEEELAYERIVRANIYARTAFAPFYHRYNAEIRKLLGSIPFYENLRDSPNGHLFNLDTAWDEVASSFTKEFCSLLGLSADSPLFIAATAGAIALPVLQKVKGLMRAKRTEWTTEEELPVEIPLPPTYSFHSIFVCPVSKEQATDSNPPMMLPCGHVLCKDSMQNASRGSRFKCPYCPVESHPREAKRVYL